jgi:hypothetical protein
MAVTVPIPHWTAEGLIPPVDPANPASPNRSPYRVALPDVILRFSTSPERIAILDGFLNFRAAMHAIGLIDGFQWIDGSFTESIETGHRRRPPNDVDLVSFFRIPAGMTQADVINANPALFPANAVEQDALKAAYRVDAFPVLLGGSSENLVSRSAYWYSMWSHQKDTRLWKGFLEIDLNPADDANARLLLNPTPTGATP